MPKTTTKMRAADAIDLPMGTVLTKVERDGREYQYIYTGDVLTTTGPAMVFVQIETQRPFVYTVTYLETALARFPAINRYLLEGDSP